MTRCVVTIVILLCAPMVLAQNRDITVCVSNSQFSS